MSVLMGFIKIGKINLVGVLLTLRQYNQFREQ